MMIVVYIHSHEQSNISSTGIHVHIILYFEYATSLLELPPPILMSFEHGVNVQSSSVKLIL